MVLRSSLEPQKSTIVAISHYLKSPNYNALCIKYTFCTVFHLFYKFKQIQSVWHKNIDIACLWNWFQEHFLILKNSKSDEASNSLYILGRRKESNIFSLCQCLVKNIHNKLMENAWDTRAYLPKTPLAISTFSLFSLLCLKMTKINIFKDKMLKNFHILTFNFRNLKIPFSSNFWNREILHYC